jgi:SPP1 family predicted phage head-tail adaptor
MLAGRLKERISIVALTETQSTASGELVQSWSTVLTAWAAVEPISGREYFASNQFAAQVDTRVTMRYTTVAIGPEHKIVHRGTEYQVRAVIDPMMANRELQIMAFKVAT